MLASVHFSSILSSFCHFHMLFTNFIDQGQIRLKSQFLRQLFTFYFHCPPSQNHPHSWYNLRLRIQQLASALTIALKLCQYLIRHSKCNIILFPGGFSIAILKRPRKNTLGMTNYLKLYRTRKSPLTSGKPGENCLAAFWLCLIQACRHSGWPFFNSSSGHECRCSQRQPRRMEKSEKMSI